MELKLNLNQLKRDPVAFIREVLINPETGRPYELYPAEERFIREALTPRADGGLPYAELLFSAPKKSGKSTLAAMAVIYVIVALGGPFAEAYCVANDFEQAQGRVFQTVARIIEAAPLLRDIAKVTANRIEFKSTGATITAIASDYASAAGGNPSMTIFDELWAFSSERSRRLWDEMVPVPTRTPSVRLTVTYAGFSGESELLENLYARAIAGEQIAPSLYRAHGLLAAWQHEPVAPWQTPEWLEQMHTQLRPNAYLRMIENRWVAGESSFIDLGWWDACVDPLARPIARDPSLPVWVGVDASLKRDSTAIVAATWDKATKQARLVWHRVFQPSPDEPLDFEATVEASLLDLKRRFYLREVRFDPYQMISVAQRLRRAGVPMVEFPQTPSNLTEASNNLFELIKGRNLIVYPDEGLRKAVSQTVALESGRGWRLAKEKQAHKIDVVIALAQAALGAVEQKPRNQTRITDFFGYPLPDRNNSIEAFGITLLRTGDPVLWDR